MYYFFVQTRFDIVGYDESERVRENIEAKFARLYSDHRSKMHSHYKQLVKAGLDPKTEPYKQVSKDDWNYIIEHVFKDPEFQVKT